MVPARRLLRSLFRVALGCCVCVPVPMRAATSAEACPRFTPVTALDLEEIYHDPRASVPDIEAEKRNKERLKPLTDFMRYIEQQVDDGSAGSTNTACAFAAFRSWAIAGALTKQPSVEYSREGTVTRNQDLVGLLIIALKLKKARYIPDPEVIEWLRTLTYQDLDFFEKATNRGNLYYWSGAAAALFALLHRDQRALGYQEQVWRAAIAGIGNDGTIAGEMARGQRALIYHMYAFSALLMLHAVREPLGHRANADTIARLELLARVIGRTLCNPDIMGNVAEATIETPGDWAYRVPIGLGGGFLDNDWRQCGKLDADTHDIGFGGDTRATADVLRSAGSSAH